jgi:tetratricopeptide (TPR) repeat protein
VIFRVGISTRLADNRGVSSCGRRRFACLGLVILAGVAVGCARGAKRDQPLSTLESARRVRYVVAAEVAGDASGLGPAGTTEQLRQWVAHYLAQVGLSLVGEARSPQDVELHLSLAARGGTVLLYGTAGMLAMAGGRTVDQWSTSEHVEPASGFARALARELVESLVHSPRLAAHADAASGGAPAGPVNGNLIPAVAVSTALMPPSPPGPATAPPGAASSPAPAGDPTAAARAHARQGQAFYDLKRFQEAYQEYEQAYLIEQDPALLYNMGQCQRKLGNGEEALHFYRTYLRRVPKGPSAVEAEKRVRELEAAAAHSGR